MNVSIFLAIHSKNSTSFYGKFNVYSGSLFVSEIGVLFAFTSSNDDHVWNYFHKGRLIKGYKT